MTTSLVSPHFLRSLEKKKDENLKSGPKDQTFYSEFSFVFLLSQLGLSERDCFQIDGTIFTILYSLVKECDSFLSKY